MLTKLGTWDYFQLLCPFLKLDRLTPLGIVAEKEFMMPSYIPIHVHLPFIYEQQLQSRMSLIIAVRKCRKKGNCQRSQNNNIVAIKQTHGLLVLRQGLSIIFGARTFDPFYRIWNLCQMEEVNYASRKQEDLRPAGTTRVMLLLPETSSQTQQKSVLELIRLCSLNNIRLLKPLQDQTHGLSFI